MRFIYLLLPLLMFVSPKAWADVIVDFDISWINASENVDGSAYLDASRTTVYFGTVAGSANIHTEDIVDPGLLVTNLSVQLTVPGNIPIIVWATHTDLSGNQSALSAVRVYGPFAETDVTEPNAPGLSAGSATVVGCTDPGFVCGP